MDNSTCTPPEGSPFSSSLDYRKYQLNREYLFSMAMVIVFIVLFLILFTMIMFFSYKLLKKLWIHYKEQKNRQQNKQKNLQNFGSEMEKFLNFHNDNYEDIDQNNSKEKQIFDNEKDFTDAIQKSIEKFQKYNYKIQQFFKDNYNESAPDVIDKNIFNEKYDNW